MLVVDDDEQPTLGHVLAAELEAAGYVTRTREGRRNTYEVNGALPLRHAVEGHQTLNSLIKLILEDRGS